LAPPKGIVELFLPNEFKYGCVYIQGKKKTVAGFLFLFEKTLVSVGGTEMQKAHILTFPFYWHLKNLMIQ